MSLTYINFDWPFYFSMIAALTLWVCGVTAITRKGKIGYPLLQLIERKKKVAVPFSELVNHQYDEDLLSTLKSKGFNIYEHSNIFSDLDRAQLNKIVREFLIFHKVFSHDDEYQILVKLAAPSEKVHNEYYFLADKPVLPSYLTDPVLGCVTCMPSLHGLAVYTAVSAFKNFYWNPLEWIAVAIPTAFCAEFLWKLKKLIGKEV